MNHAIVTLDETGSMRGQRHRVVTSLNEYVKQLPKKTRLTVFKFDSQRWTKFFCGSVKKWKHMKETDYRPGAMTPLYDAIAKSIAHAESVASNGDKVMVMIDTDGYENASREHTQASCLTLVSQKKKAGWEFLFMSAGVDQKQANFFGATGKTLGMRVNAAPYARRSANYSKASVQTRTYFREPDPDPPKKKKKAGEVSSFFSTTETKTTNRGGSGKNQVDSS